MHAEPTTPEMVQVTEEWSPGHWTFTVADLPESDIELLNLLKTMQCNMIEAMRIPFPIAHRHHHG